MTDSFWHRTRDKVANYTYEALVNNIIPRCAVYGCLYGINHNDVEAMVEITYGIIPLELGLSYVKYKKKRTDKEIGRLEHD